MDLNLNENLVDESIPDASLEFQPRPNLVQLLVDLLQQHTQNFRNDTERSSSSHLTKPIIYFKSFKSLQPPEFKRDCSSR